MLKWTFPAAPARAQVPVAELSRVSEQAQSYPEFSMFRELPAWGFYARHAQEIEFRNVRFSLEQPDFRPAMVFDDVGGLRLKRVDAGPISGAPVIVLNDVPDALLSTVSYPKGSRERLRLMGNSSLLKTSRGAPGAGSK